MDADKILPLYVVKDGATGSPKPIRLSRSAYQSIVESANRAVLTVAEKQ
jgi:hypothetical protein